MTPTRPTRLHAAATAALALLLAAQSHAQTPAADWPYGSGVERRQSAPASTARTDSPVFSADQPQTAPIPANQANANVNGQGHRAGRGSEGRGRGSGGRNR
jgi:hypothetical protein